MRHVVPLGAADRAEQDRVRRPAQLQRSRGERRARRVDGGAAHQPALELERGTRALADRLQDADGLGDHLLADPVPRQDRDPIRRHHVLPIPG